MQKSALKKNNLDISHDIKTPITVVQGYAKELCDGVIPVDERAKYLKTIEQKASGLNDLINTFYEYSKLEHPAYTLTQESVDICNYLRDYVAEQYAELELSGFTLEVDIPEEHIPCSIDRIQLRRAFANIIGNATKHNKAGTTLCFTLTPQADHARILLMDDGVGIPEDF
ncbi:MAG: HAMP domain-containing sensor histidine kinase [Angelakisella sp.]|nr:HAMP domain-containing sensor histidine kinase [Angelakisella sp.]